MSLLNRKRNVCFCARKRAGEFLCALLVLLAVSVPLFSQGSQGAIQGAVFDQSGGAIAGATVTVTDVARGVTRNLVTDTSGQYVATSLTPSTYTVRAEAKGFKAVEHSGVLVEVGNNVRVDLTVEPGEQTQTVTVTSEVAAIDATNSTLGGSVSNQSINALPLNGRNFFRLLDLRPGVVTPPGIASGSTSTNGRRLGTDVLLVEGITQFDMATSNNLINGSGKGSSGDSSNLLPLDAVQEFNTQQNAPAEYGWRDGSVINVGIKSGTNGLHGTAYAFGRNAAATDAANYFTSTVTPAQLEQFGASVGGRIRKDKLFWFAAYEGMRVQVGSVSNVTYPSDVAFAVADPTKSMVDACNAVKAQAAPNNVINPLSAQLAGLNVATCAVTAPNNTLAGENVFPYNQTTSTVFSPNTSQNLPLNNGLAKLDWIPTDHQHVSFFYYDSRSTQSTAGAIQPYWSSLGISKTQEYTGRWTWTPSSTWVNDLTAGWAGALGNNIPGDVNALPVNAWTGPGGNGYSMNTGVTKAEFGGFPTITFSSFTGANPFQLGVGGKPGVRGPQGQLNIRDTVSYLRGSHAFKFGFEHVLVAFDDGSHANVMGSINFASLQAFLTGTYDGGASIVNGDTDERLRARWYAGFVEDTWRLTHKITLTPGVRYEYDGPPHEVDNHLGVFDPSSPTGLVQVGPGLPHSSLYKAEKANFSPRLGFAWDVQGTGKTVVRAGVSLLSSWPGITALAAGTPYASSFFGNGGVLVQDNSNNPLNKLSIQNLAFGAPGSANQLNWNTTGPVFPINSASGPQCTVAVPCGTFATDPNFTRPRSINWNLDIQRALNSHLTMDVAYVGNHGYNETYSKDLNAVPVGTGWNTPWTAAQITSNNSNPKNKQLKPADANFTGAQICQGLAAGGGGDAIGTCPDNTFGITAAQPFNPQFPWFNYIVRTTSGFHSNYDGLQFTLDARGFHGVSFLTAYTYSHALDQWTKSSQGTNVVADPSNPQLQYGASDYDIRHRFRFSPTWNLPGMKSPGQMLEGWTISGVLSLQSGLPWGPVDATKDDFVGTGENLNNVIPTPNGGVMQVWNFSGPRSAFNTTNQPIPCFGKLSGCTAFVGTFATLQANPASDANFARCVSGVPYAPGTANYTLAEAAIFNLGCYIRNGGILTPPAYGTDGNAGRNSFVGAPFKNVDLSISKTWHLKERYSAQFRFEVFNAFNHTTFGPVPNNPNSDPTKGNFGRALNTPDSGNPVFGSGGPRHIQFGLKLAF